MTAFQIILRSYLFCMVKFIQHHPSSSITLFLSGVEGVGGGRVIRLKVLICLPKFNKEC